MNDHERPERAEAGQELAAELVELMRTASAPPADPPREAMWAEIAGRIESEGRTTRRSERRPGWQPWSLGLAACLVLLVGIALGRGLDTPNPVVPIESAQVGVRGSMAAGAARTAALGHLTSSETLLSFVDAEVSQGALDPEMTALGRTLLRDTRLLLDVLPDDEVRLRVLLEDLELLLSQVAILDSRELDADRRREEMNLLSDGLRTGGVLSRIQAVLPLMESDRRDAGRGVD